MDNNGSSTLAKIPIKPIVSTIGFIPMLFWFAKIEFSVQLFNIVDESYSVFQIMNLLDKIKELFSNYQETHDFFKSCNYNCFFNSCGTADMYALGNRIFFS
ncbi:MAG: hypothetical protein LUG95_04505 [Clostridiales bacterium]|nr:hypothetical protein [Clostridiales bacterium]